MLGVVVNEVSVVGMIPPLRIVTAESSLGRSHSESRYCFVSIQERQSLPTKNTNRTVYASILSRQQLWKKYRLLLVLIVFEKWFAAEKRPLLGTSDAVLLFYSILRLYG